MSTLTEARETIKNVINLILTHSEGQFAAEDMVGKDQFWIRLQRDNNLGDLPNSFLRYLTANQTYGEPKNAREQNALVKIIWESKKPRRLHDPLVFIKHDDAERIFRIFATADQRARLAENQGKLAKSLIENIEEQRFSGQKTAPEILTSIISQFNLTSGGQSPRITEISRVRLKGWLHRNYRDHALYDREFEKTIAERTQEILQQMPDPKQPVDNLSKAYADVFQEVADQIKEKEVTGGHMKNIFMSMATEEQKLAFKSAVKMKFRL